MKYRLPLLTGSDLPFFPLTRGLCPVCNSTFANGSAYITGGATVDLLAHPQLTLTAFFSVGFHGKNPEMADSGDVEIVHDLNGGQFDIRFCSIGCLRNFLAEVVDRLVADVESRAQ